jgi:hypothetical protein
LAKVSRRFDHAGLDPRVGQHFHRLRIDVGGKIAGSGLGLANTDCKRGFRLGATGPPAPMHGGLDLASARRVAAAGRAILGTRNSTTAPTSFLMTPVHFMKWA